MKNPSLVRTDLVQLGLLAVLVRIGYFLLALQHLGMEGLVRYAPDTGVYTSIAEYILVDNSHGHDFLFWVGPGYGLVLAGVELLFGPNLLWVYALNILAGSLAPIAVYILALRLTDLRSVGFLAGLISCLSTTSISLSCNILSDQLYFTTGAFAMLSLILGCRTTRVRWFVLTGLILGIAAYLRPVGMLWPVSLFVVLLLVPSGDIIFSEELSRRKTRLMRMGLMTGVAMLMILGWATRNYMTEGVFVFGGNGVVAFRQYVVARAIADYSIDGDIKTVQRQMTGEDHVYHGGQVPTAYQKYHRNKDQIIRYMSDYPGRTIRTFCQNIYENVRNPNYFLRRQVPVLTHLWWVFFLASHSWLVEFMAALSLVGIALLAFHRRYTAAFVLAAGLGYYTLIVGLSLWQGSRLHYPAELLWSILVSYTVCVSTTSVIRVLRGSTMIANTRVKILEFLRSNRDRLR